jgi:hypothetical protein
LLAAPVKVFDIDACAESANLDLLAFFTSDLTVAALVSTQKPLSTLNLKGTG